MNWMEAVTKKRDVLTAIEILKTEFVCCAAEDYEAECISCQARRIVDTMQSMVDDGDYDNNDEGGFDGPGGAE